MANPRKRKARIREALQKAAERAKTEEEQELVRRAAEIALRVGKLNQAEINEALNSIDEKENDSAKEKQTVKKPAKKATKKATPKKRSTRKRTTKSKE
tara:strand:+ start:16 stop:309 length:294 start_codon:yes stop_codon:yes gene_type:complete